MKVVVSNESGELYSFVSDPDLKGVFPTPHEKPAVLEALAAATKFLNQENATPELSPAPETPPA